jgi:hypothetical protein
MTQYEGLYFFLSFFLNFLCSIQNAVETAGMNLLSERLNFAELFMDL